MKLTRYRPSAEHGLGEVRWGAVVDETAADGAALLEAMVEASGEALAFSVPQSMQELLELGPPGLAAVERALAYDRACRPAPWRHPLERVRLEAPVVPPILMCTGENYQQHLDEKSVRRRREPEFFIKSPTTVIGPAAPITLDHDITEKLDFEVELAVVIGAAARNVEADQAREHIAGYTILNDLSARDRQVMRHNCGEWIYDLVRGKNFDGASPLGPLIVTPEEVGDPQVLEVRSRVNGALRQRASTAEMITAVAEIIAYFSRHLTLHPGTVIATGTPGGTAWGEDAELGGTRTSPTGAPRYLREGDTVSCEISGLGELIHHVVPGGHGGGAVRS